MPSISDIPTTNLCRGMPLVLSLLLVTLGVARPVSAQDRALETPPPADDMDQPREQYDFFSPPAAHTGFYFRGSGMHVEPQNDGRLRDGSGTVETNDDFGLSFAFGYNDLSLPLSIEIEYAYRSIEFDDFIDPSTGLLGDDEISLHTLTVNLLFDQPDLLGPVGVYAGVGAGFHISRFRFSTAGGAGSTTEVQGEGFFWQAMAGVTISLDPRWQLYSGVRWADAGSIDDDALRIDAETFDIEFGVRFYF